MNGINILLVGVGGQGIILASNLLGKMGLRIGLDVKKSEIHGMAQRGGSVESHVRLAPEVLSPLIPLGQADFLVCMEQVEVLRHLDFPRKDGVILVSKTCVIPPSVTAGDEKYPAPTEIEEELRKHFSNVHMIDVPVLLKEVGNPRTANLIMLGALSTFLSWRKEDWDGALAETLPAKILEVNSRAFETGRKACEAIHK